MAAYTVETIRDDNDTWLVTCPALPEVTTFVDDLSDLDRIAGAAVDEALCARLSAMSAIPDDDLTGPYLARPSLQTSLKCELFRALRDKRQSRADLVRALKWNRNQVDRLFQPGHATRTDQYDAAFRALGRVPVVHASPG